MRWVVLLLLAWALPALADKPGPKWPLKAQDPDGQYELQLTRESPVISNYAPSCPEDAHTGGERLAFLANEGNRVIAHVRETQDTRRWFVGMFKPTDGATVLEWPYGQTLMLALDDGRTLEALEIIVSRGHWMKMGPVIPIMPARAIAFSAIEVEYPNTNWCFVVVAFPPGRWDAAKVTSLEIWREVNL